MKKGLFIFILCCVAAVCVANDSRPLHVSYAYDAAGNRVDRTIIMSAPMSRRTTPASLSEAISGTVITIHPNPTEGHLCVEATYDGSDFLMRLSVFTTDGECLLTRESREHSTTIDLTSCPPGTYILSLTLEGENRTYKIVKQ